jgi:hypothetical protein
MYRIQGGSINGFGDSFNGYDRTLYRVVDLKNLTVTTQETNVSEIAGFSSVEQIYLGILQSMTAMVNTLNGKYPTLNLSIYDNPKDAGEKMILSGVDWSDVDVYGARLKMLYEQLN